MIEIEKEKIQLLLGYFYDACGYCDELNILSESNEIDTDIAEMRKNVGEVFKEFKDE